MDTQAAISRGYNRNRFRDPNRVFVDTEFGVIRLNKKMLIAMEIEDLGKIQFAWLNDDFKRVLILIPKTFNSNSYVFQDAGTHLHLISKELTNQMEEVYEQVGRFELLADQAPLPMTDGRKVYRIEQAA